MMPIKILVLGATGMLGQPVVNKASIIYLGSLLSADGVVDHELGRRIGLAASDFKILQRVWGHTGISQARKLQIFNACVVSKLLYGLDAIWMNKCARRRLDGFQARCLRRITGVPPSFVSRVSNDEVRRRAEGQPRLSTTLLKRQLHLMGRAARDQAGVLPRTTFQPGTFNLQCPHCRCVGRPRLN